MKPLREWKTWHYRKVWTSVKFQQFGFQLTDEPITVDNVIQQLEKAATETNVTNSRYTFSNDSDIENLVRSTESKKHQTQH